MNQLNNFNPLEYVLLMLLGGGSGGASGLPPEPEDPIMLRVAPADCIAYVSWAASGQPDGNSRNTTEQLLAEPAVQRFLKQAASSMTNPFRQGEQAGGAQPWRRELEDLFEAIRGLPGALYVSSVELNQNGSPSVRAGGLLRVEGKQDQVARILASLQQQIPDAEIAELEVGGRQFTRIAIGQFPPLVWGIAGKYLVVAVGDGEAETVMEAARSPAPQWLKSARQRTKVPRVASTAYINVGAAIKLAVQAANQPQIEQALGVLGLDKPDALIAVNGMDGAGCMTHTLLDVTGTPSGVLAWLKNSPLDEYDLELFGSAVPLALAVKLDARDTFDGLVEIAQQLQPERTQQMLDALSQFEEPLEISIRDDLLGGLGDSWRLFVPPGPGGFTTGWSLAIEVRNRERLERAHAALLGAATALGDSGPTISQSAAGGNSIQSVEVNQSGLPISPSWCITNDNLFITLSPDTLRRLLGRRKSLNQLVDRPGIRSLIEERDTVAFSYVNTRVVAKSVLPIAQAAIQMLGANAPVSLDTSRLPPSDSIVPHLLPTRFALRRTEHGAETIVHQTLPGGNGVLLVPVAVAATLPAVAAARTAAVRVQGANNLKQIGLALHNYHGAHQAFPASHSADESGNPLLSWRVHILPFLGEEELYQQFHLEEPWNSPHNMTLVEQMPAVFQSPPDSESGKTAFVGVGGPGYSFVAPEAGTFLGTAMASISDGTTNTVMVVEVPAELAATWTEPVDYAPDGNDVARLIGRHRGGFHVLMADGQVHFLPDVTPQPTLSAMFTIAAGDVPVE